MTAIQRETLKMIPDSDEIASQTDGRYWGYGAGNDLFECLWYAVVNACRTGNVGQTRDVA